MDDAYLRHLVHEFLKGTREGKKKLEFHPQPTECCKPWGQSQPRVGSPMCLALAKFGYRISPYTPSRVPEGLALALPV